MTVEIKNTLIEKCGFKLFFDDEDGIFTAENVWKSFSSTNESKVEKQVLKYYHTNRYIGSEEFTKEEAILMNTIEKDLSKATNDIIKAKEHFTFIFNEKHKLQKQIRERIIKKYCNH